MNNWKINKTVDLAVGVNGVDVLPNALLIENDSNAHEINITVMDDGLPVELNGTATAYFVRVDDATVIEPATANGNVVSVTLPEACYAYEGDLKAVIRITDGESTVTLGAFLFFVRPMTTNFVVDPSEIVPSLEELLQQIQQIENVSKAANDAAESANTAADSANKAAEAAQAVMDDIEAALDEAGQALSEAKHTKELSESALNDANQALENANTATSAANDATNLANEAADGANAAADAANQAATDAESRVSAAVQSAETSVDEAIKNAQQQVDESLSAAQQTLDSAVSDANSAVENAVADATAATQAANTAASGADTAAAGANAQANAAEQAAQTASNAAGSAQTATEAAEDATRKALDAAERANNAASGTGFQKEVLDHLPEPSEMVENVLYLVPAADPNPDNVYEEYMLINGQRELIGSTAVDLTGYAKTEDVDAKLAKKLDATGTAAAAVQATQDSAGNNINATYIKGIEINGTTVTVTRGDGSTFELTTQDTDTTYQLATNLALGLTKLYDTTGNAADGAMTQGAATTELGKKLPLTGGTLTGPLIINSPGDSAGKDPGNPALIVGGLPTGTHMAIDNNEIAAKTNANTPAPLYLNNDGGAVVVGHDGIELLGGVNSFGGGTKCTSSQQALGIQSGWVDFGDVTHGTVKTVAVTFEQPFASGPNVIVGLHSGSTAFQIGYISVGVQGISATGFNAKCFNAESGGSRSPDCYWIAIGQIGTVNTANSIPLDDQIFDDGPYADPSLARADYIAMMAGIEIPADAATVTAPGAQSDPSGVEGPGLDEPAPSARYETVKLYYDADVWNAQMVRNAVGKWVTADEAEEILADKSE